MSLSALPTELLDLITGDLSIFEHQMLHLTCKSLYHQIPHQRLTPSILLEAEETSFATRRNLLYCNSCIRLRWREHFIAEDRGAEKRTTRFCLPCALRPLVLGESEDVRQYKFPHGYMWTDPITSLHYVRGWCSECKALVFEMERLDEFPWMVCAGCLPGFRLKHKMGGMKGRGEEELVAKEELVEEWWEADEQARRVREEEEGHGPIQHGVLD